MEDKKPVLVCASWSAIEQQIIDGARPGMADPIPGRCNRCDAAIGWQPEAEDLGPIEKICLDCMMQELRKTPDDQVVVEVPDYAKQDLARHILSTRERTKES